MKKKQRIYSWFVGIFVTLNGFILMMDCVLREESSIRYALTTIVLFAWGIYRIAYMIDYSINKEE